MKRTPRRQPQVAERARRQLGQHFLLDGNLCRRIARAAGALDGKHVIEIGPGPGGLTKALLEGGAETITAVEKDDRFVAALQPLAKASNGRLHVIAGDALEFDVTSVTAPRVLIANLPYNIAAPLLVRWTRIADAFSGLVVMVQKEMADRLTAAPGTADYGRLGIMVQWRFQARAVFNVDPRAFVPPPKVMSTVVALEPRPAPLAEADPADLERVTAAAFGQRRKMLRTSLKALEIDPAAVGIDATRRAETLSIVEFCALARLLRDRASAPDQPAP